MLWLWFMGTERSDRLFCSGFFKHFILDWKISGRKFLRRHELPPISQYSKEDYALFKSVTKITFNIINSSAVVFNFIKLIAITTKLLTTFTAKMWKMWAPKFFKSFQKNQFITKARQNALCKVLSSLRLPSYDQWQKSNGEMLMPVIMIPQAMKQNKVFLPCSPGCSWASSARLRRSTATWCRTSAPPRLLSGRTAWWCCGTCGHFKPSPGWSMEVSPRTNLKSQRENWKCGLIKKEKKKNLLRSWSKRPYRQPECLFLS